MHIFITIKKKIITAIMLVAATCTLTFGLFGFCPKVAEVFATEELYKIVKEAFDTRNAAVMSNDLEKLELLYDTSTRYGTWAYEHEVRKLKYLRKWSDKQGIRFTGISSKIKAKRLNEKDEQSLSGYLIVSTEYKYVYENAPDMVNTFRIGTYHSLSMVFRNEKWLITKQWHTDPFADSLQLDDIKTESIRNHILSQNARDFSSLLKRRIQAVEYADRWCGAANDEKYGFVYNKKYRNYNGMGGDCANFASQILHEGGKFRKAYGWNYDRGGASKAWVNAGAFKNYMLGSGRASLIAYGNYNKVYKASYKLLPGDFVAYEKKGDVTHISVVTGADSQGYTLINCHNTDRYKVPWDLGWSDKGIRFWLVRVHF